MSKLIKWDVPFAGAFFPSVIASFASPEAIRSTTIMSVTISASDGTRYLVECEKILAFSCLDESCAPQRDFGDAEVEQVEACAWQSMGSPWIKSYEGCNYDSDGRPIPLNHFFIFGGDYIVEFVCQNEPSVSQLPNWQ